MNCGKTLQEKNERRVKNSQLLINLKSEFGLDGRAVAWRTGYSEKYISNILNEKVDVEEKVWRFFETLFQLECLKHSLTSEAKKSHFLALADQFNSDQTHKTARDLASYTADAARKRRKGRKPTGESAAP